MKKIRLSFLMLGCLLFFANTPIFAQITEPEEEIPYGIVFDGGGNYAANGHAIYWTEGRKGCENLQLKEVEDGLLAEDQIFYFEPTGNSYAEKPTYYLKQGNGKYVKVWGNDNWCVDTPTEVGETAFSIDAVANEDVYIRVITNGTNTWGNLGIENKTNNWVHGKMGNSEASYWKIVKAELSEDEELNVAKAVLQETITTANDLKGNLPLGLQDDIQRNIDEAEEVYLSATTFDDIELVRAANNSLKTEILLYNSLLTAIANAETTLDTHTDFEFPEDTKVALQTTIANAKSLNSPDEIADAIDALNNAARAYLDSELKPRFNALEGVKYRIAITDNNGEYVRYMHMIKPEGDERSIAPRQKDLLTNPELQLFYLQQKLNGNVDEYYIQYPEKNKYLNGNGDMRDNAANSTWTAVYNKMLPTGKDGAEEPWFTLVNASGNVWRTDRGTWPDAITWMWNGGIGNQCLFRIEKNPGSYDMLQILIAEAEALRDNSLTNPEKVKEYFTDEIALAQAVEEGNDEQADQATIRLAAATEIFNDYEASLTAAKAAFALPGDFPKSAKDALNEVISAAENIASSSAGDVKNMISNLKTNTADYIASQVVPKFIPEEGVQYRFYATASADGMGDKAYYASNNEFYVQAKQLYVDELKGQKQLYTFIPQAENNTTYKVKGIDRYMRTSGQFQSWNEFVDALVEIKYAKTKNNVDYYTIHVVNSGNGSGPGYVGFDGNNIGILTNEAENEDSGSNAGITSSYPTSELYFFAFEADGVTLKRELLAAPLAEAAILYNTTEAVESPGPGQYPLDLHTALGLVLENAKAVNLNVSATGEEVRVVYKNLVSAVEAYKEGKVALLPFEPEVDAKYRIYNPNYDTFFSDSITGSSNARRMRTQDFKATGKNFDQKWTIEKVADVDSAYLIKNAAGNVLTYVNANNNQAGFEMAALKTDGTELLTQYLKLIYSNSNLGTDYFILKTYRGEDHAIGISSKTLRMETFNASSTTHPVTFIKVSADDLDRMALDKAIKSANTLFLTAVKGNTIGTYAPSDYDAFEAAISAALAVYENDESAGDTQEKIDAAIVSLNDAKTAFENAVIVDFESFRTELIVRLKLWAEAEVSPITGAYYQSSIDAYGAVLKEGRKIIYERDYITKADKDKLDAAIIAFSSAKNTTEQAIGDVLTDAIDADRVFLNAAQEGTAIGEYPTGSKATFETAINTAAGGPVTIETLNTLNAARKTFEEAIIGVNTTDLNAVITAVESILASRDENTGDFNNQYPASAFDELQQALNNTEDFLVLLPHIQALVDEQKTVLEAAKTTFESKKVVIDFANLTQMLTRAKTYAEAVTAGPGSALESIKNTLLELINAVTDINGSQTVSQEQVDEATENVEDAYFELAQAVKDDSGLGDAIDNAQSYVFTPGTEDKEEVIEALYEFQEVIEQAQALYDSSEATSQQDLRAQIKDLDDATTAFVAVMTKDLVELIAEARDVLADGKDKVSADAAASFGEKIDDAENIATSSDSRYQDFLNAYDELKEALDAFKELVEEGNGLKNFAAMGIKLYTVDQLLYISGLNAEVVISAYDLSGSLVFTEKFDGAVFTRALPAGSYIVSVQGYVNASEIVMVK